MSFSLNRGCTQFQSAFSTHTEWAPMKNVFTQRNTKVDCKTHRKRRKIEVVTCRAIVPYVVTERAIVPYDTCNNSNLTPFTTSYSAQGETINAIHIHDLIKHNQDDDEDLDELITPIEDYDAEGLPIEDTSQPAKQNPRTDKMEHDDNATTPPKDGEAEKMEIDDDGTPIPSDELNDASEQNKNVTSDQNNKVTSDLNNNDERGRKRPRQELEDDQQNNNYGSPNNRNVVPTTNKRTVTPESFTHTSPTLPPPQPGHAHRGGFANNHTPLQIPNDTAILHFQTLFGRAADAGAGYIHLNNPGNFFTRAVQPQSNTYYQANLPWQNPDIQTLALSHLQIKVKICTQMSGLEKSY